jgi:hypothetical protein
MCMPSVKMPETPPPPAPAPPAPQPTAKQLKPSDALQARMPSFGGSAESMLSRLRIPLKY